ncbi:MAG: hypothetical protein ACLGSA_12590 [Acidobacteriota bacterium]
MSANTINITARELLNIADAYRRIGEPRTPDDIRNILAANVESAVGGVALLLGDFEMTFAVEHDSNEISDRTPNTRNVVRWINRREILNRLDDMEMDANDEMSSMWIGLATANLKSAIGRLDKMFSGSTAARYIP